MKPTAGNVLGLILAWVLGLIALVNFTGAGSDWVKVYLSSPVWLPLLAIGALGAAGWVARRLRL